MDAILTKPEPIWWEIVDEHGKKSRVRKLKVSLLVDLVDFSDALSYDGATMKLFRPDEYAEAIGQGNRVIPHKIIEGMKTIIFAWQDLLAEAEKTKEIS